MAQSGATDRIVFVMSVVLAVMAQTAHAQDDGGQRAFAIEEMQRMSAPAEAPAARMEAAPESAPERTMLRPAARRLHVVHGSAPAPRRLVRLASEAPPLTVRQAPAGPVSIYEDRTLREGDAVMTGKGLKVFAGSSSWPYRDSDFKAIADVRSLDKATRQELQMIARGQVY